MPKVNKEPVRKSRISCTCARKSEDTEDKKGFEDCSCGLVGQRDSGKRYKIKNISINPLEDRGDIEKFLFGEL